MLRVSKGMESGEIVRWLKSAGQPVRKGELLLEIESEKAVVEVESPESGVLLKVVVDQGETVEVGSVVGWVGETGEAVPDSNVDVGGPPSGAEFTGDQGHGVGDVRAAPAVRRTATRLGVSLNEIEGTGPGGRITIKDVETAAASTTARKVSTAKSSAPPDPQAPTLEVNVQRVALKGIRKVMARRLAESAAVPATTVMDVDMTAVRALRERIAVTYTSPVVLAVALALREHSLLNASLDGDEIVLHQRIDIGLAVDTAQGLVVVTVPRADEYSLVELDRELRRISGAARGGQLRPEIMTAPTFTVTNSGVLGSTLFMPIINPPQSATLGMGKVEEAAVVLDGRIVARPIMYLCLTYDHRLIEGAEAVRFLSSVKQNLEEPEGLGVLS
jgi:pyruvate/2-oxoglutarate dehydrogenase complex dihydrolipoamide acyltransferase (E2) component